MRLLLTFVFSVLMFSAKSQSNKSNVWIAFLDSTSELHGYKDLQGNVKIPPRYTYAETDTFRKIAFVLEKGKGFVAINRSQQILFHPFIFDNGIDDFASSLIRITDQNKKIGFADTSGNILIPPIYDWVLPFNGNFTAFYSGGKQQCADGEAVRNCEHLEWVGGKWGIINKANDTIITITPSLTHEDLTDLNLASLTDRNPGLKSYIAVQGKTKTYYLENVRLGFQDFLETFLERIKNRDSAYFSAVTFPNIECSYCLLNTKEERKAIVKAKKYSPGNYYTEDRAAEVIPKAAFISQDLPLIFSSEILENLTDSSQTVIFIDLENFVSHYSNPNSAFLKELAPQRGYYMFNVVLSHYKRNKTSIRYQEHFDFIKTDKGIKFIRYDRTSED